MFQVAPSSDEYAVKTSLFPLADVNEGVVLAGNRKDAGHVTALAVPSAVNSRVKLATAPVGTLVIVKVEIPALSDTAKKLDVFKSRVNVPLDIVGLAFVSLTDCNCGLSIMFPARL